MKVFVLFTAIIGMAISANLCERSGAAIGEAAAYKTQILNGASYIFGHCSSLDFDTLLFGDNCLPLFNQAFCYGQLAKNRYEGLTVVTYGHLAADVPNIQALGVASCAHGRACFDPLREAFAACAENENFVSVAVQRANELYLKHGEQIIKEFANSNPDTLLGELINVMRGRFQSVEDVTSAYATYSSDAIVSDAKAAAKAIEDAAVAWCDANCHVETGPFLVDLFSFMNKGKKCNNALSYCGQCQKRADRFLMNNDVPCCLNDVIQQSVAGVQYIRANYNQQIEDLKSYLSDELSVDAVAEATAIRDRVIAEIKCLRKSYGDVGTTCA